MDDYLMIGPKPELMKLHEDMKSTMLLRDITLVDDPGDCVQFLGWILTRTAGGFDVSINTELAKEIVEDAGLQSSGRHSSVPGFKDRILDETPATDVEHRYYRTQVGRLLFYVVLRPDMQYAVTQLSKYVHVPTQAHLGCLRDVFVT